MNKRRLLFVVVSVFLCAFQSIYAGNKDLTNWIDGGKDYGNKYAYDTGWYDATASEYTISTPAEMGAFAVASATDAFEGKTVKLAADLDMSKYGWVSLGAAGFKGTFDGMGHTITAMSYKDESQAKAWGLFHTIDGGTVKNIVITGSTFANEKSGTSCPSVGGIASILKGSGVISNCGFSGTVHLPFDKGADNLAKQNGLVGGLVGVIESGTVVNSYVINNEPTLPASNDTIYGNIAGKSNGTISNCYYLENEIYLGAVNSNQEQGIQEQVQAKAVASFASGEVAYLLNAADGNAGTWGQGESMPVFAGENISAVYKIGYPEKQEYGVVNGPEYASAGETVTLTSTVEDGYLIKDLAVTGTKLVNYSTFVMPASDVNVTYSVEAFSSSSIVAFPAEDIKGASFVAKWNKVDGATGYKITVKKEGVVLDAYNALAVGDVTSVIVEGLRQNTTYTYTVQSVKGETTSLASNEIVVTTGEVSAKVVSVDGREVLVAWEVVEGADHYGATITGKSGLVSSVETTDCEYLFRGLDISVTYTLVVVAYNQEGDAITTSLPVAVTTGVDYGTQLTNSTFEAWEKEGDEAEPVGWNSFMSGGGSLAGFTKNVHMEKSEIVRPGSNGSQSVRIWTKAVFGVPANGNLTCGKINSGNMVATDQANHNRTIMEEPEFNQPLNGARPDSLTVWVNFSYSGSTAWTARVAATIHDAYNYADPSATLDSLHAVAKAEMNYPAVSPSGGWQRLSIPFDYELKNFDAFYEKMNNSQYWKDSLKVDKFERPTSADYMLVTFATNSTPGKGTDGDQVLIDDMLLIYKPVLKLTKSVYQPGEKITVDYTLVGTMSPSNIDKKANVVSLELSDATGSFANPKVLTEIVTDKSGQLIADIEEDLMAGNYKVRVVTTNYPMVSEEFCVATGVPAVNVAAATDIEGSAFVANWEVPSVEPTKYLLTVKQGDIIVGEYNDKEVGNVTSYNVEGLTENTTYTYVVKAVYDEVTSGASQAIEVVTVPVIKGAVATDIEENAFVANWEAPVSIQPTNYLLTVKEGDAVVEAYVEKEVGTVLNCKVEGLKKNTVYTYTVKAVYGKNVAKASEPIEVRTLVATTKALAATDIEENAFVANWEVPVSMEPTNYLLTVKEGDEVVEGYKDLNVAAVTSYKVEGLKVNTAYTYTVKAVYGELISKVSNEITVTTLVPAVKALDATEIEENAFVANWTAPDSMEPTQYLLTVKEGDAAVEGYNDLEVGTVVTYKVENLKVNTAYTYTVKAVYGEQVSKESNRVEVTTLVPAVKALAATEINITTFVANWETPASMEPTNYLLTVKEDDAIVEGYNDLEVGIVTSYKVEGLKSNTAYTYTVKAVYNDKLSLASEAIEVTTLKAVGIGNMTANNAISVYPNPAVESLYIDGVTENSEYVIYDISGKAIDEGTLLINKVDVSSLKTGMYFIETESGKTKFIKK
ncbi:fibronectin type III domain-containing protein [Bacteroides salyersiae]|uniref:fibronectin type III domain-containing protein n=1 Tax=Bacteroides salyersiae TaxID=291644 RepID=UPI001C383597|nr:fibronectin type III domain-containing protein [Bacteroides salyersiae]MBV4204349.1 fibronectin type III domain-containing protein [Bacteroides salyersiae]MCB6649527.1 fibronectin type III domain-containing protein [Bacteroides salyersiae]